MQRFVIVPIALVAVTFSGEAQDSRSIQLQGLPEDVSLSGAGTYFYFQINLTKPPVQVFSYPSTDEEGQIQINGQIYHLKFESSEIKKKGKGRRGLGERKIEKWKAASVSLTVDYTVTSLQEEGLGLTGNLTINFHGQSRTYSITGYWGS